ncbi:MAG: PTS lactose/cellobiose transporter subunit IIA [Thermosediminibacteraceae bacterium]|nr:PTS lactose/cellobiose transporter subunit IIA [Thermosediminibacteraceae bacterium]
MNPEQIIFTLISHAGNARSYCFDSLKHARSGNFKEAKKCLRKAGEEILEAHHVQTEMIQKEVQGEKQELSLLLVHAQDHLMNAMLAKDLVEEMISLYEIVLDKRS